MEANSSAARGSRTSGTADFEILVVELDTQLLPQVAAGDEQPAPTTFHLGVIVGFGRPIQSGLAPFKGKSVLAGIGQHLGYVVEDPHDAKTTVLVVQFRPECTLDLVSFLITLQRIELQRHLPAELLRQESLRVIERTRMVCATSLVQVRISS